MKNIIIDLNILLDFYGQTRRVLFEDSVRAFEYLKGKDYAFISSSSIDNYEFIQYGNLSRKYPDKSRAQKLKIVRENIKEFLSFFKIAKTPSYIELDYDDIEDSQIIASAKAIDAKVLTRDEKMLEKYPNITISPSQFTNPQSPTPNIDFANLKKQHFLYHDQIEKELDEVLQSASFIMGDKVQKLEYALQEYTGAKHAITCSSGTDALLLALMAFDIGQNDEVITTPFTFIATAEVIALLGAKPVFVDIDEKTYNIDANKIEEKITSKTKAIVPVSLYGQPAQMDKIDQIAKKYNLKIIIDGAQSFGSTCKGVSDSALGDISCTSFFPAKPLGCYGDGGAVFTSDSTLAEKLKQLRVHGQNKRYHHRYIGLGGRLDTIQAALLHVKLSHYKKDLALRQEVAKKYDEALKNKTYIITPHVEKNVTSAYAQYSIRVKNRDKLQEKLKGLGIPTAVHYPMPLHLQECFEYLGYKKGDFPISEMISQEILSLPLNPYLSDEEIDYIVENL